MNSIVINHRRRVNIYNSTLGIIQFAYLLKKGLIRNRWPGDSGYRFGGVAGNLPPFERRWRKKKGKEYYSFAAPLFSEFAKETVSHRLITYRRPPGTLYVADSPEVVINGVVRGKREQIQRINSVIQFIQFADLLKRGVLKNRFPGDTIYDFAGVGANLLPFDGGNGVKIWKSAAMVYQHLAALLKSGSIVAKRPGDALFIFPGAYLPEALVELSEVGNKAVFSYLGFIEEDESEIPSDESEDLEADEPAGRADSMGLDMLTKTAPNSSQVPPEELYATQLSQLRETGFIDTRESITALIASTGNVHAAVDRLTGNPGQ